MLIPIYTVVPNAYTYKPAEAYRVAKGDSYNRAREYITKGMTYKEARKIADEKNRLKLKEYKFKTKRNE